MKRQDYILKAILLSCIIGVAFLISGCVKHKRARMNIRKMQYTINDSMFIVNNYYDQFDTTKVSFYLFLDRNKPQEDDSKHAAEAEKKRKAKLNDPMRFYVDFRGSIDGYHVSAEFHPEDKDENDSWGMSLFHFKSPKNDFVIETVNDWDNWYDAFGDKADTVKFNGERGSVKIDPKAFQGIGKEIEDPDFSPFVFKDVDFDGEKEILFLCGGYNRSYWTVYKVIGKNKVVILDEKPYNNLVYGMGSTTEFDYKNKTIYIREQQGASDFSVAKYIRKRIVTNKLDPMRLLLDVYYGFGADGNEYVNKYDKKGWDLGWRRKIYVVERDSTKKIAIEGVYNLHADRLRLEHVLLYCNNKQVKRLDVSKLICRKNQRKKQKK